MENINIKINKKTRMITELPRTVIGNDGENLQENLVFSFDDEFVEGQARLELIKPDKTKSYLVLSKVNETYQIPVKSVITKTGRLSMQLVIDEGIDENSVPIFKSNIFYVVVNSSINAEIEEPDEYPQWIDIANAKINSMDIALEQVDNLDIDVNKIDNTTTVTVTKKDGTEKTVEIYDGQGGSGGTSDYSDLDNKPQINSIELDGNKTLSDLGIQPAGNYLTEIPSEYKTKSQNDALYQPKGNYALKNEIPINMSELTNDGDGTTGSRYATEDYVSLNGGKIDKIMVDGIEQEIVNKEVDIDLSDKLSTSSLSITPEGQLSLVEPEYDNTIDFEVESTGVKYNYAYDYVHLASTNYVLQNAGKIDKIKVDNVEQTITNKTVNIDLSDKLPTYSLSVNENGYVNLVEPINDYTVSMEVENTGVKYSYSYDDIHLASTNYVQSSINSVVGNINTVLATLTTPSNNGGN